MTPRSRYVGGVEPAVAELQDLFGIGADLSPFVISLEGVCEFQSSSARSDKTGSTGPFETKREFVAVRMPAWCADLLADFATSAFTKSESNESPARHHTRRALGNSVHHHHDQEAMTHGQYAHGAGIVKPSA
jgi:hypothetical protein